MHFTKRHSTVRLKCLGRICSLNWRDLWGISTPEWACWPFQNPLIPPPLPCFPQARGKMEQGIKEKASQASFDQHSKLILYFLLRCCCFAAFVRLSRIDTLFFFPFTVQLCYCSRETFTTAAQDDVVHTVHTTFGLTLQACVMNKGNNLVREKVPRHPFLEFQLSQQLSTFLDSCVLCIFRSPSPLSCIITLVREETATIFVSFPAAQSRAEGQMLQKSMWYKGRVAFC